MKHVSTLAALTATTLTCALSTNAATVLEAQQAAAQEIGGVAADWTFIEFDQTGVWGFPDGSLNNWAVNNSGGDAGAGGSDEEITMTITGLTADTDYEVWVMSGANTGANWGVRAGYVSGGPYDFDGTIGPVPSPGVVDFGLLDTDGTPGKSAGDPFSQNTTVSMWAVQISDLTTDGLGNGPNIYIDDFGNRTFFDGIIVRVVPEPSSLALLGLGGLLIARRRRG